MNPNIMIDLPRSIPSSQVARLFLENRPRFLVAIDGTATEAVTSTLARELVSGAIAVGATELLIKGFTPTAAGHVSAAAQESRLPVRVEAPKDDLPTEAAADSYWACHDCDERGDGPIALMIAEGVDHHNRAGHDSFCGSN